MSRFYYSEELVRRFPNLCTLVVEISDVFPNVDVTDLVSANVTEAKSNLARVENESILETIKAWRTAYSEVGINPTKHRMAAESIIRRLRLKGDFPTLHPLVTLCNSLSAIYALPIAALDAEHIAGDLCVQPAQGGELYVGFDDVKHELPGGEITFRDSSQNAHARRWSHKQSKLSAVNLETRNVLVFAEAVHDGAPQDLAALEAKLVSSLALKWPKSKLRSKMMANRELAEGFAW